MEYFQDIKFIHWNRIENYSNYVNYYPSHPSLQLVRRGKLQFAFGTNAPREISAPVVFWEYPSMKCIYGNPDRQCWDHSFITFAGPRAKQLLLEGLMPISPNGFIQLSRPLEFIELYNEILRLLDFDHQALKHARAAVMLEELVVMLAEAGSFQTPGHYTAQIEQLCCEIRTNPLKDWDFHALAGERFFISYVYFRQLFKNISGSAPGDYLNWCRMRHAMELMRESSLSISEIAYECKYLDSSAFSRAFKRKTGISAQEYRRSLRKTLG